MKKNAIIMVCILFAVTVYSQSNPVISLFPEGTVLYGNISYNDNSHEKHLLDIYLPANAKEKVPVLFFIHGGGWLSNDKYADMNYMKETVKEVVENGFALVSIDTDSVQKLCFQRRFKIATRLFHIFMIMQINME